MPHYALATTKVRGVWLLENYIKGKFLTLNEDLKLVKADTLFEGLLLYEGNRVYELFLHDFPRRRYLVAFIGYTLEGEE